MAEQTAEDTDAPSETVDLLIMFTVSGDRLLRATMRRTEAVIQRFGSEAVAARQGTRRQRGELAIPEPVEADTSHLAERLGLYVIIVLGEGVIQVTSAASDAHWDLTLGAMTLGGFVLLVGIWALSLLHGFAGVPHLLNGALPVRLAMALHCFTTGTIAAVAAGLGAATEQAEGSLPTSVRWVLCASAANFFALGALAGIMSGARRRWLLGWALPCVVVPLVLGLAGDHVAVPWLVWPLVAAVCWQLVYESRAGATT